MLLLDLDYFKEINDTYGHDAGDRVLIEVAGRFKNCVRTSDIVARMGGDEFLIVIVNCEPPEYARTIARDIVLDISAPIHLGPRRLSDRIGIPTIVCPIQIFGDNDSSVR